MLSASNSIFEAQVGSDSGWSQWLELADGLSTHSAIYASIYSTNIALPFRSYTWVDLWVSI